jgi:hypothetical protein
MKKVLLFIGIIVALVACNPQQESKNVEFELPAVDDIAMYQVNPRVFAPNNSLNAVAARIDSIRDLGVNIMWVMPIYPIGIEKGKNSPYCISDYKAMADRVQQYYIDNFIDKRYGGVFWTVDPDGGPDNDIKQTYAQAYAIYGLAEHFRATGDEKSLDAAIGIFRTLEEKVHDHAKGGYRKVLARNFSKTDCKGVDGRIGPAKTMNTHTHPRA